jgi:hypothetical protein
MMLDWESLHLAAAEGAQDQSSSARRCLPSKGEARAPSLSQPRPGSLDLDNTLPSCSLLYLLRGGSPGNASTEYES